MDFTPEQLNAIEANGTVLVAAAAGSGKTAVLVERVINRFCDLKNPLMADRALIVTFTNAAASELKSKISQALKKKLAENPNNELIKRQNLLIENASICTIDSFCISLVRENFASLNISHDFKIADSNSVEKEYNDLLDNMFYEKFNSGDEIFNTTVSDLQHGYDDYYLKNIVRTLYKKSCAMPYQTAWLDGIAELNINAAENFEESDFKNLIFQKLSTCAKSAELSFSNLAKSVETLDYAFGEKYDADIQRTKDYISHVLESVNDNSWDELYNLRKDYTKPSYKKNSTKNAIVSKHIVDSNDALAALNSEMDKCLENDLSTVKDILKRYAPVVQNVVELVKEYKLVIDNNSFERNTYSFDQIEHLALALFTESENAIKTFNEKYDAILVDEYQDTSNLQDELFKLLSAEKRQLFMVGDVKQSIYGFRNANPDNFLQKKNEFPLYKGNENPCKVLLTGNFRSRKKICKFINFLFSAYMTKSGTDMEYNEEEALVPQEKYNDNHDENDVEIFLVEKKDDSKTAIDEAESIAQYILATMQREPFLDDGDNGLRKANFSDFVILMRSAKNRIGDYVKTLKSYGIPVNSPAEKFSESVEIITALSMLKAIYNPSNSISVLALMTSPVFGFTEDEVSEIRMTDKSKTLYSNVLSTAHGGNLKCKSFIDFLNTARTLAVTLPVNKLLIELYEKTGLIDIFTSTDNGEFKRANLYLLIEYAAKFSDANNGGLYEFIKYIESDENSSLSANVLNSDDAVRIMSIHNSKGLQFPICIVCSLATNFNKQDIQSSSVCDDNLGIAFKYHDKKYDALITPISHTSIANALLSKMYKEELRLLYVALTRAKEKLVLFSTVDNLEKYLESITGQSIAASHNGIPFTDESLSFAKSYSDWIFTALLCHKNGVIFRRGEEDFPVIDFDCSFNLKLYEQSENKLCENVLDEQNTNDFSRVDLSDVLGYEYPYKIINTVPAKTSVTDILKTEKPTKNYFLSRPAFLTKLGLTPAERGTATHKFMEFCDYSAAKNNIETEIERLVEWQYISEKQAEAIDCDAISAFFESRAYELIKNAREVYKEYRFLTDVNCYELNENIPDTSGEYSLVQGVADCVAVLHDSIAIIDYKTDSATNEGYYISEYSHQLKMYADAISKIFGMPVSTKIIYSFKMKKCIEL